MGTYSADGAGKGYSFLDDLNRLFVVAEGYLFDIFLAIGVGRTVERTGAYAIALVIAHKQLESYLAGLVDPL